MKELVELLGYDPNATLVSLGCGAGWWEVQLMHQKPAKHLILIDSNSAVLNPMDLQETLDYFQKIHQKALSTSAEIRLESAEKTSLQDQEADVILLFNSFHEFDHQADVAQEMYRIGKKGGQILIEEELATKENQVHQDCGKALLFERDLIDLMENAGFIFRAKTKKDEKACYLTFEK